MIRVPVLAALAAAGIAVALAALAALAPWLCAWLILCLAFAAACRVSWRMTHDTFAPLIPVTAYLFLGFGVRGIALREGWLPNTYNVPVGDQWLTVSVWLLAAAAIASCVLGYRSGRGPRVGQRWGRAAWVHARWPRGLVEGFAIATALIGAASLVLLRHRFASVSDFGHTPAAVASQTSEGGLFTIDMLAYFPLAGVLLTWRRKRIGPIGHLATIVNLAILIAWFVLAGRKSLLFELVIGLVVLRHYLGRRIRGSTVILLVVPVLILVSLAFYFKDYGFRTAAIAAEYSKKPAWEAVVDPLLDRSYQFDAATMIVDKTRSVSDYRLGSTLDDLLWFYVPRQWWPGKPVSFGYGFAAEFFPGASQTASYTPSMVGELYLDFGVLGVIFGFYLFGVILRACYEAFAARRTHLATAAYVIVLFRLTNMVEGPVSTHIEFLLAETLPLVVFVIVCRLLVFTVGRHNGKRRVLVVRRRPERYPIGAREGSRVA
jgi:Putative O-antigen polymerase